jgi:hypothetical protein
MSHLLKEVQMKALGCVMHLKDKTSQMHFREAFIPLTLQLDLDDVGYLYHPVQENIYTVPGQLLGAMNNGWMPAFAFGIGVRSAVSALNMLDDDYDKLLVVATDSAKESDMYYYEKALEEDRNSTILVYAFGDKWHPQLSDHFHPKLKFFGNHRISEAKDLLKEIIL